MDLFLKKHALVRTRTPYLSLVLSMLLVVGLAGCDVHSEEAAAPPPPPAVDVARVKPEPVTLWDGFTGRVVAPESVELRPRVSGYIDKVAFEEGELVKQGDLLFQIDARPYQAAANAAKAELSRARSQYALARSEARRAKQLLDSRAISQEEYDQRESAMATAQSAVLAAEAALDSAELNLEYTEIRSPINGRVSRAFVTRGNLASSDQTLLTRVVSVDPVYVYFESDEQTATEALNRLGDDQLPSVKVSLAGEDGFGHEALVDFVDNQLDASTGTLQYRAVMANPEGIIRPGQFARVQMPVAELDQALLVDQQAVLTDQDRRYVYVLEDDNKVNRRYIEPGERSNGLLVVHEGLKADDRIVVNGLQKILMPGMQVAPELVAMRPSEREQPQVASTH
ncbi:efflux RND transporter periplasmic adaptor subunit [Marinobacter nanhaiticus D15-8W]|uniref:Efflux RND transporter periplasmic adaptor subunit n=1 Tax=Marinobacter nanhaiticus D15-8W TaxID=626887 RepID=N6X5H3_9GAMM|nr:efflux RND transporter periplasmic adaptor subunit [Marinobacter nanhaiticus]ENO16348.1 efflux RND transporter periplasmic adaptor subunit [Marinobacter nanhaiticus D15-8W]BES72791.1 efflux RND transporter periplasmic adaptor subunit [Marinobacter nanhaiticus D15-8W]